MNTLERIELLIQTENLQKLQQSTVLIVGIGGVGSYAAEALARSGIGTLILVDKDVVVSSNLNRQIHATYDTINQPKTEVMKQRILSFNKHCNVITFQKFYDENLNDYLFQHNIDFVIDAIDTLTPKFQLIQTCLRKKIKFISSVGMGNRLDATQIRKGLLSDVTYCPMARQLRKLVKKHRILKKIPVIYSLEHPITQKESLCDSNIRKEKMPPASVVMGPAVSGMMCASVAIQTIINKSV